MKIAVVGTAPYFEKAPFSDKSWRKWTIAGCYNPDEEKRNNAIERIYEIHPLSTLEITCEPRKGFIEFAKNLGSSFIIQEESKKRYPNATVFDHQKYIEKHGHKRYFTSSVAWMLAEAIEELENSQDEEKVIGIWGVNMATDSEYCYQKPGCFALMAYAEAKGIKITGNKDSELFVEMPIYGIEKIPDILKRIKSRRIEILSMIEEDSNKEELLIAEVNFSRGALMEHDWQGDKEERKKSLQERIDKNMEEQKSVVKIVHMLQGSLEVLDWLEMNYFNAGRTT